MSVKGGYLSKNQFMKYFGELHSLLRSCRTPEMGFYLTEVDISDIPDKMEVKISFVTLCGPMYNYNGYDTLDGEMVKCKFTYVYSIEGVFKGCYCEDVKDSEISYNPLKIKLPSFKDFPTPNKDLFGVIERVIYKCRDIEEPLHNICFCSPFPSWSFEYRVKQDDGNNVVSQPVECIPTGVGLTDMLTDKFNFCYTIQPCEKIAGEYSLTLWVNWKRNKK